MKPPAVVAAMRTPLTEVPSARAASAESPTMRTTRPQRVLAKAQAISQRQQHADGNSALTCSAACTLGESLQPAQRNGRDLRRLRLDQRLAQVEGQPGAEQHQRDAGGHVVDARQRAHQPCSAASAAPLQPASSTPTQADPLR
jgi:hypothetical protein